MSKLWWQVNLKFWVCIFTQEKNKKFDSISFQHITLDNGRDKGFLKPQKKSENVYLNNPISGT